MGDGRDRLYVRLTAGARIVTASSFSLVELRGGPLVLVRRSLCPPILPTDDDAILAKYEGAVRRYCLRRTHTPEDAEDAVQEAFIRFVRRPERDVPNPEAWLLSTARYACADVNRRHLRHAAHTSATPGGDYEIDGPGFDAGRLADIGAVDPSTIVTEQAWLQELFRRLSPRDRLVMDHLYVRDASLSDLARLLGVTIANAGVIANRARNRARAILEDMGRGLGGLAPTPVLAAWRRLRARLARARRELSQRTGGRPLDPDLVPRIALALRLVPFLLVLILGSGASGHGSDAHGVSPAAERPGAVRTTADHPGDTLTAVAAATPSGRGVLQAADGSAGSAVSAAGSPGFPPADSLPGRQYGGLSGLTTSILAPGQNITQQDVAFSSLTPSPSYARDGTVYASGSIVPCLTTCPALFRSQDRGTSWQHVDVSGFLGGRVLLPPTYSADSAIFADGTSGLQRSDDGGATFHVVLPGRFPAAVDPTSPAGDTRIVVGTVPLLVYDELAGTVAAGPVMPAGLISVTDLAYTGSGTLIVSALQLHPLSPGQQDAVIVRCAPTCAVVSRIPGPVPLQLALSPTDSTDHTVVVFGGSNVIRVSSDGGFTFSSFTVASVNTMRTITFAPDFAVSHRLWLLAIPSSLGPTVLLESLDAGRTFSAVGTSGLPPSMQLTTVVDLPGGRLIAALDLPAGTTGFGLRCATGAGAVWRLSC